MLEKLLKFYKACHCVRQSLWLALEHDKVADWFLTIQHEDSSTTIFESNDCSLNLLCAHAYIALADWAKEDELLEDIEGNI